MHRCWTCHQQRLPLLHCSQSHQLQFSWPAESLGRPSSFSRLLVARLRRCLLPTKPMQSSSMTSNHCPGRSRLARTSLLQMEQLRMSDRLLCQRSAFRAPDCRQHNWHCPCTQRVDLTTYRVLMRKCPRQSCRRSRRRASFARRLVWRARMCSPNASPTRPTANRASLSTAHEICRPTMGFSDRTTSPFHT